MSETKLALLLPPNRIGIHACAGAFASARRLYADVTRHLPGIGLCGAVTLAAIVGAKGEIEHGSALIHTLAFGDPLRRRIGATTLLPAVEKRDAIGASFDIPLKHCTDATMRSHHQSVEVRIADAPPADEIVIALAAAAQGRPQARLPAFAERPGTLSLSPAKG